jgi:hypothetical protein
MAITPNTTFTAGAILTASQMNRLPWGIMGTGSKTADQNGITTVADITSLSVTFTAVSTRYYRTTLFLAQIQQNTAAGSVNLLITDATPTTKVSFFTNMASGDFEPIQVSVVETGLTGSITRKGRISTSAGTIDVRGSATIISHILVEDLGQA